MFQWFQIAFLGASALFGHESEAEGKEEENRGERKLSRWGWGFLPQVNQSSSALICLVLSILICQKEETVSLLPVSRDIVQKLDCRPRKVQRGLGLSHTAR